MSFFLKEAIDVPLHTLLGTSFHILIASTAKLSRPDTSLDFHFFFISSALEDVTSIFNFVLYKCFYSILCYSNYMTGKGGGAQQGLDSSCTSMAQCLFLANKMRSSARNQIPADMATQKGVTFRCNKM